MPVESLPISGAGECPKGSSCHRREQEDRAVDLVTHPDLVRLHQAPEHHPESHGRLEVLISAFPDYTTAEPATRVDLERVHPASYLDSL